MTDETALTVVNHAPAIPQLNVAEVTQIYASLVQFKDSALRDGIDYGKIPGAGNRPTLLQPGAQKLCVLFGVHPDFEIVERIEDWTGEEHGGEPFFRYLVRCRLINGTGQEVSQSFGEINSWEPKYRTRKGGVFAIINTLVKMGQKRALVGATMNLGVAEFFTQDIEDFMGDDTHTPPPPPKLKIRQSLIDMVDAEFSMGDPQKAFWGIKKRLDDGTISLEMSDDEILDILHGLAGKQDSPKASNEEPAWDGDLLMALVHLTGNSLDSISKGLERHLNDGDFEWDTPTPQIYTLAEGWFRESWLNGLTQNGVSVENVLRTRKKPLPPFQVKAILEVLIDIHRDRGKANLDEREATLGFISDMLDYKSEESGLELDVVTGFLFGRAFEDITKKENHALADWLWFTDGEGQITFFETASQEWTNILNCAEAIRILFEG